MPKPTSVPIKEDEVLIGVGTDPDGVLEVVDAEFRGKGDAAGIVELE